IVLASGEVIDVRRGDLHASDRRLSVPLATGVIDVDLPSYQMPRTRKNATGYFVAPNMDLIDLFIGSEGTLGVAIEIEVRLLPKPSGLLSGVVFFPSEVDVLTFMKEARSLSLRNRLAGSEGRLDARALEFFDRESLNFLREKYPNVPKEAV